MSNSFRSTAFGLVWASDLPLRMFHRLADDDRVADVGVTRVRVPAHRTGRTLIHRGWVFDDGVRLQWEDIACLDMFGGDRVTYAPGPGWTGDLPDSFYGTVAAMLLAWRGALPFHAGAVTIGGRAVLICGTSGAGKSSLTSALCTAGDGTGFLADDLAIVVRSKDGVPSVLPGRATMRLHSSLAARLGMEAEGMTTDGRGKLIVRPSWQGDAMSGYPLAAMIVLGDAQSGPTRPTPAAVIADQLFRPRWLMSLPGRGRAQRQLDVYALSRTIPVMRLPSVDARDLAALQIQAAQVRAALARIAVGS